MAVSHNEPPESDFGNMVDMLYLCDSVRDNPALDPYTSVDVSWFTDYCKDPVPHAAADKADIVGTLAAWPGFGEYVWALRSKNRWHPDSGQGTELNTFGTGDISHWNEGLDALTTVDELINTAGPHSGQHNGTAPDNPDLIDNTNPWSTDELIGQTVTNQTTGASGTITDNTANKVIAALTGGTSQVWNVDDDYLIDAATEEAFIYRNLTLEENTTYAFRIVPTAQECTKLRIEIEDGPTTELDLTAHTGGNAITQVDARTYEHEIRFYHSAETGSKRVEIRMITSGEEYDGLEGDRVKIEWISLRERGDTLNYDLSLSSIVPGTVLHFEYVSNTDDPTWKYTFPKTPLEEVGNPGNVEVQTDYPDADGFSPADIIVPCNEGTRYWEWGTFGNPPVSGGGGPASYWFGSKDTIGFFWTEGFPFTVLSYDGDYTIKLGGPLDYDNPVYRPYGNANLIDTGEDSPFIEYWNGSVWVPKRYYYEDGDWVNSTTVIPYPVGAAPHGYPKGFAYIEAKQPVWDAAGDRPWEENTFEDETSYSTVQVVPVSQTVRIVYDDLGVSGFPYYRSPPNDPHQGNWSEQLTSTSEDLLTTSDVNGIWSKSVSTDRVINRTPEASTHWDPSKIVTQVGRLTGDINLIMVDAILLWADSDGTDVKAIVSWRTRKYRIEDPHGGQGWVGTWHHGDDPNTMPTEWAEDAEFGVDVTGESSISGLTSWAEAASKFRGMCFTGSGRFVYFEHIVDNEWRMHVTGGEGGDWTLDSTPGESSNPDCIAASERHFYVRSFHLLDDRMQDGHATAWVFSHEEAENAWPIRTVGDGSGGTDRISGIEEASTGLGTLNHDSIKNSSVLPEVPEQDRWPDRVP